MARSRLLVGVELGTAKVAVVVAECYLHQPTRILGTVRVDSVGVRKGEVVDVEMAKRCGHEAILKAEDQTGADIDTVYLAVTGGHIEGLNAYGSIDLNPSGEIVYEEQLNEVQIAAKQIPLPAQKHFLHTVLRQYTLDGKDDISNALGMTATKLGGHFHLMMGHHTRLNNSEQPLIDLGCRVKERVFSGLASSFSVVPESDREHGCLMLDMGAGCTEYLVYQKGALVASGVLAVGGDHITNDLSMGLRLPVARAEKLKKEHGSVDMNEVQQGEVIRLVDDPAFAGKEVDRYLLNEIMRARVEEMLKLIRTRIEKDVDMSVLVSGAFITGGCARMRGLEALVEEVLDVPANVVMAETNGPALADFEAPELSTAYGLVRYAEVFERQELSEPIWRRITKRFSKEHSV
ncbi:MAG: cell division protein FtsA [Verrucomicrobiales bacterium]